MKSQEFTFGEDVAELAGVEEIMNDAGDHLDDDVNDDTNMALENEMNE